MIKSMTGFGRSEVVTEERKIVVEMKAVNHRFCDISIKMPKKISFLETTIRTYLKKYIERGKVDVFITYEDYTENKVHVKYNRELAALYMKYFNEMADEFGMENQIIPSVLGGFTDVFTLEEQSVDEEELWELIKSALDEAAQKFVKSRDIEGENLKNNIIEKLDNMLLAVDYIEELSPMLVAEYRQKLTDKITELLGNMAIDENRIATEVVIYADKICVDEETVRLKSHIDSTKKILEAGGSVGRKLDFIAQEMNREANTILSKANSLDVSNKAIELKTDIEKVREQIQNLE
ncbi:MAG: YicC family protein [Coprococcus sp.]|nr:YicC family protein [Coprococcus sp.]